MIDDSKMFKFEDIVAINIKSKFCINVKEFKINYSARKKY